MGGCFVFGFCFLLVIVWGELYVTSSKGVTHIKVNVMVTWGWGTGEGTQEASVTLVAFLLGW